MTTERGGRTVWRPLVAVAMVLVVVSFIAACSAAPSAPVVSPSASSGPGTSSAPGSSASPQPGSSSGPTASGEPTATPPAVVGPVSSRIPPNGATAPIDDDAWLIAERLAMPTYTADTTAAAVEGLARSGIGTYTDPTSTAPDQAVTGLASPLRLLDFQAHALAVGAWGGSSLTGAELDTVLPMPAGSTGVPSTSQLLAGYVAAADSPGGALSRALMAGQDLLSPTTLRFPAIVLDLFVSDLATDGGRIAPSADSGGPSAAAAGEARPLMALAETGTYSDSGAQPMTATTGICSSAASWISGVISSLFNALKVATPSSVPGFIIASIWNWFVSAAEAFVRGLLTTLTDAVLGTVRSIAASVAAVATQIASLLPYVVKVEATGPDGSGTFTLGTAPLSGTFTASVTAGDLPEWPAVLADCAATANVALADFHAKSVPVTWGPLQAPADPKLGPTADAKTDTFTDANGQATWSFTTSTDPGDPNGDQQTQTDVMPVSIHRPEIEEARAHLTTALLGFIPGILRPFVASLFAPYIDGLQARLNTLLDAHGSGSAVIVYHDPKPSPTITPPASPGVCNPNPVAPGNYAGTTTATSSEIIDLGVSGGVVDTGNAAGKASIVVAADGSLSGTWDMTSNDVFDETAAVNGVVGLKEHRVSTTTDSGNVIGTACDLVLTFGAVVVVSCVSLLTGDCTGDVPPTPASTGPGAFGPPSTVSGGNVTWTFHYASDSGANVVYDLVVAVSRSAP